MIQIDTRCTRILENTEVVFDADTESDEESLIKVFLF